MKCSFLNQIQSIQVCQEDLNISIEEFLRRLRLIRVENITVSSYGESNDQKMVYFRVGRKRKFPARPNYELDLLELLQSSLISIHRLVWKK